VGEAMCFNVFSEPECAGKWQCQTTLAGSRTHTATKGTKTPWGSSISSTVNAGLKVVGIGGAESTISTGYSEGFAGTHSNYWSIEETDALAVTCDERCENFALLEWWCDSVCSLGNRFEAKTEDAQPRCQPGCSPTTRYRECGDVDRMFQVRGRTRAKGLGLSTVPAADPPLCLQRALHREGGTKYKCCCGVESPLRALGGEPVEGRPWRAPLHATTAFYISPPPAPAGSPQLIVARALHDRGLRLLPRGEPGPLAFWRARRLGLSTVPTPPGSPPSIVARALHDRGLRLLSRREPGPLAF
jgi:hypothetical protein